jgi:two-component system, NarL family, sensor kinase
LPGVTTRPTRVPFATVLAGALITLGCWGFVLRMTTPGDGTDVRYSRADWLPQGLGVDKWFPNAHGIEDGDVLVAIEGRPLHAGVGSISRDTLPGEGPLRYLLVHDGVNREMDLTLVRPVVGELLVYFSGLLLYLAVLGLLALWLRARRPAAPLATPLMLGFAGTFLWLVAGPVMGVTALDAATAGPLFWLYHVATLGGGSLAWGAMVALGLVPLRSAWPDAYPLLRASAYTGPLVVLGLWTAGVLALGPPGMTAVGLIHAGQEAITVLCWVTAGYLALQVYLRASPPQLASLRWVFGGGLLSGLGLFALWLVPDIVIGHRPTSISWVGLAGLPILIGIVVAILHHHLYAIERVVSRVLWHALLGSVLFACYLAVVALATVTATSSTLAAGLAATVTALIALPVREALRRRLGHRFFGGREEPAEALRALGRSLARIPAPQQALAHVVVAVTEALRLPYSAVEFADPDAPGGHRVAESVGSPIGICYTQPLRHHGRPVGRLVVSARETDEPLSESDIELLGEIAGQLGAAVRSVALHQEVLRSRTYAVTVREDERRRLRRDLHDGLSPTLTGLSLKVEAALVGLGGTSADARLPDVRGLLRESAGGMRTAARGLRDLVDGLRPPALDALGLTGAIRRGARELTAGGGLRVDVSGPARDVPLPAAVEVAAFHIAVEGLTNSVRHGQASCCTVRIRLVPPSPPDDDFAWDGLEGEGRQLCIEVWDDGRGLPDEDDRPRIGVGLRSIRERAEELGGRCVVRSEPGGGTVVRAALPCGTGSERTR